MGSNNLFPKLLIVSLIAFSSVRGVFAATTASQTITGNLGQIKQVVTNGGNITATIDENTGILSTSLTPGFTISTNSSNSTNLILTASCNTSGVAQNAFSGTGAAGSTFLTLTNSTVLPGAGSVIDAQSASPTPISNANVITYSVTPPSSIASQLAYTWDSSNIRWDAVLTHKGSTNTLLTIPSSTPKANTFSTDDASGAYQATITLSFV